MPHPCPHEPAREGLSLPFAALSLQKPSRPPRPVNAARGSALFLGKILHDGLFLIGERRTDCRCKLCLLRQVKFDVEHGGKQLEDGAAFGNVGQISGEHNLFPPLPLLANTASIPTV